MILRFLTLTLCFFSLNHCGPEKQNAGPFKVYALVESDQKKPKSTFSLEPVTLETLDSLDHMTGKAAQIFGSYVSDQIGQGPKFNSYYVFKEGASMPTSYQTLGAFTAYYHFEAIYSFFIKNNLLDESIFLENYAYFQPIQTKAFEREVRVRENAAFDPVKNSLYLYKSNSSGFVPYHLNRSILAHEFGHKIMFYLWAKKDPTFYANESIKEEASSAQTHRSLDEGFADWISFAVTQNEDGISKSLGDASFRNLNIDLLTLSKLTIKEGNPLTYERGSLLTHALYKIYRETNKTPKKSPILITQILFKALENFRKIWIQKNLKKTPFLFSELIKEIIKEAHEKNSKTKAITKIYCDTFIVYYDAEGNKEEIEKQCKSLGIDEY